MELANIDDKLKKAKKLINDLIEDYEKMLMKPLKIAAWSHIIICNQNHISKTRLGSYKVLGSTTKILFKFKDVNKVWPVIDVASIGNLALEDMSVFTTAKQSNN